jgi:hypothetical protein
LIYKLKSSSKEMTNQDIALRRLYSQHIATPVFNSPDEVVKHLGAVQAQDYAGARWALGLRMQNAADAAIDKAMADGSIIRTHVLRPTWHFITPADARWMLDLTAPRIIAYCAPMFRKLQLDAAIFKRSNDALANALAGGRQLNRMEMQKVLQHAGIATDDLRFIHLLMRAELDKVICSGARQGKQFTYALFDDRVTPGKIIPRREALTELARRYFISRGPATLADFIWWSGLAAVDAKIGLESIKAELTSHLIDGQENWMPMDEFVVPDKKPVAYLLPAFDEFAVAYKDRSAVVNPLYLKQAGNVIFAPAIVVNNQIVGTWKRTISKNGVDIILNPFGKLTQVQERAVEAAQKRYLMFMKGKKD